MGALAFRRSLSLATGELRWISDPDSAVLEFASAGIRVTVNLGPTAVPLPEEADVLLASEPLEAWTRGAGRRRLVADALRRSAPRPLRFGPVARPVRDRVDQQRMELVQADQLAASPWAGRRPRRTRR